MLHDANSILIQDGKFPKPKEMEKNKITTVSENFTSFIIQRKNLLKS